MGIVLLTTGGDYALRLVRELDRRGVRLAAIVVDVDLPTPAQAVRRPRSLLGAARRVLRARALRRFQEIHVVGDVNSSRALGHLFAVRESWTLLRREAARLDPGALRRLVGLARRVVGRRRRDPNDRFDEWLRIPGRHTFFVASYGLFDRDSDRFDVPYDIHHPEAVGTFRTLAESGAEIGIHLSLRARHAAEQVRREVDRLGQALGRRVRVARRHWWALGEPPERALTFHAQAGVELDCSFGFNDRPGFRRGIAVPFHPYDRERDNPLTVWSLPTTAMDAAVFRPERDFGECVEELKALYEKVAGVGGALVLDWHAHALNPAVLYGAGDGLREFLAWPSERGAVFRTPLELVEPEATAAV